MACFSPLKGWKKPGGGITFTRCDSAGVKQEIACGRCIGCRIDRSRQWAVRCMHESTLHEENSFITLTYAPKHLPANGSLSSGKRSHLQLFFKRLRKAIYPILIRYYACGEYGEELSRPHYHALIFGYEFPDKELWKTIRGNKIYESKMLESLWGMGFCSIGDVTF